MKEPFRAFARLDRQVGSRSVADEEGVARENEPIVHDEGAVLRPVAGRVDHAYGHGTDLQLLAVLQRLGGKLRLGHRMDGNRHSMLEREPSVPGDVIGVGVRLQHAHDADARFVSRLEVLLDRVRGVDQERLPLAGVADQVGGAAEIVVDELAKQHTRKLTPGAARFLEALAGRATLLLVLVCALAFPEAAWAHARLLKTLPRDGAVLRSAPTRVRVVFADDVRLASGIKAIRNGGGRCSPGSRGSPEAARS